MYPEKGSIAPEFQLPDKDSKVHSLSDFLGKWVVLYFYPEDDTSGCTTEACGFRDNLPKLGELKTAVLGISKDSVDSHKRFAEKHRLPFTLLSDEKKEVLEKYGVWQNNTTLRTSFLINPEGYIQKVYEQVQPEVHAAEVLHDLEGLK